ncbi:hypothetical protein ACFLTP_04415 [Chloroflexota bacterium]
MILRLVFTTTGIDSITRGLARINVPGLLDKESILIDMVAGTS